MRSRAVHHEASRRYYGGAARESWRAVRHVRKVERRGKYTVQWVSGTEELTERGVLTEGGQERHEPKRHAA